MKQLSKGDGRVVKIVQKKKLRLDAVLRLSKFVFPFETEDEVLLKHTLTKQAYELTREEWRALQTGALADQDRDELARLRFLVERDYDELGQYGLVLSVLRTMDEKKPGVGSYTILPTTGCNARCIYCYEEGWPVKVMTPETADALADFICRTKREGKLRLDWFGGEPLLGAGIISRICRTLRDRGVEYESSIITNASLLTPDMAKEAAELWNLKKAQVSVDGARADYEVRKKYVRPELHNYDAAMNGAELLADAGVYVVFRCNYDAENLPGLREFFSDCAERFSGRQNVRVYLEQLFQSSTLEENAALYRQAHEEEKALAATGLFAESRSDRRLRTNYCMVDSGGRSVIVDPEGGLHLCEHDIGGEPLGTIFDEKPSFPADEVKMTDECKNCCFLPDCTAFRKTGCPVKVAACRTQMALRTESELSELRKKQEEEEAEDADPTGSDCP